MSDRPLIEMADLEQERGDYYRDTDTFTNGTREFYSKRHWRFAAILRAADAVIEAADSYCMYATPQKRNELLDAVVAYEAACREGKEHER